MAGQENVSKSAFRVSLIHLDPGDLRQLSKTLTRSSSQAEVTSVYSDEFLVSEESFSLEKTLRAALDKYAHFTFYQVIGYLTTLIGNMTPVSREESSAYTSRTSTSPVSAQQPLTKRQSDPYSTPKSSGSNSKAHGNPPREKFSATSTV